MTPYDRALRDLKEAIRRVDQKFARERLVAGGNVTYDGTAAGVADDDVQEMLDSLDGRVDTLEAASGDHGALTGLADDDHPQYATNTEFDDHSARHEDGGADALNVTTLDGFPGGTTDFLRADGTFAAPSGGGGGDTSGQFIVGFDAGAFLLVAGKQQDIVAPFSGTITGWTLLADQPGSAVVDIWKDSYANFAPTVADTITAAAKPTLSGGVKATSSTLTGWTTAVTAGTILRFNLDSVSGLSRLLLVVAYSRP